MINFYTRVATDVQNRQVAQVVYVFGDFVESVVADVEHAQVREHHFGFPSQNIRIGGILQNLILSTVQLHIFKPYCFFRFIFLCYRSTIVVSRQLDSLQPVVSQYQSSHGVQFQMASVGADRAQNHSTQ